MSAEMKESMTEQREAVARIIGGATFGFSAVRKEALEKADAILALLSAPQDRDVGRCDHGVAFDHHCKKCDDHFFHPRQGNSRVVSPSVAVIPDGLRKALEETRIAIKDEVREEDATCLECGSDMQIVRPGKHQCPKCDLEAFRIAIKDEAREEAAKLCERRAAERSSPNESLALDWTARHIRETKGQP